LKIIKYVKKTKDKYQLFMDNGEVVDTFEDVIINNNLLYNKDVDMEKYNKISKDNEFQQYYNDCLKYIKSRLRSQKEIEEFLKRKKVSDNLINDVVSRLIKDRFIDDENYCRCFIHDKMSFSTQGEYRIINDLKKAGIDEDIIYRNYDLFNKEILQEKIDKLIDKYLKSNKNKTGNILKNKIYVNLMNQGFSKEMILTSLNKYNF